MSGTQVVLTWSEQLFAAQAGVMRRISAIARNRQHNYGTPNIDLWGNDIESAGAEAAVAKVLGLYWQSVHRNPQDADGDVSGVEVRSTALEHGKLIVHDDDSSDAPFVLARGVFPCYEIPGSILGRDAKQQKYIFSGDGRTAYFVPATDLRPLSELNGRTL